MSLRMPKKEVQDVCLINGSLRKECCTEEKVFQRIEKGSSTQNVVTNQKEAPEGSGRQETHLGSYSIKLAALGKGGKAIFFSNRY